LLVFLACFLQDALVAADPEQPVVAGAAEDETEIPPTQPDPPLAEDDPMIDSSPCAQRNVAIIDDSLVMADIGLAHVPKPTNGQLPVGKRSVRRMNDFTPQLNSIPECPDSQSSLSSTVPFSPRAVDTLASPAKKPRVYVPELDAAADAAPETPPAASELLDPAAAAVVSFDTALHLAVGWASRDHLRCRPHSSSSD
jgi:hypothetical protein